MGRGALRESNTEESAITHVMSKLHVGQEERTEKVCREGKHTSTQTYTHTHIRGGGYREDRNIGWFVSMIRSRICAI